MKLGQLPVDRFSNPNLKPEKSKQFNVGVVFEPSRNWNGSLDYWTIRNRHHFRNRRKRFQQPVYYNDPKSFADFGWLCIDVIPRDEGESRQAQYGRIRCGLRWRGENGLMGRFGADLVGTIVTEYEFSTDPRSPLVDGLAASATTRQRFNAGATS